MEDDLDNIKRYGGRETDDYVQLVCGGHGRASYTVITRDQIEQQPYDFYRFVYSHEHASKNKPFQEVLSLPELHNYPTLCAGIDCGFVDPTVISIMGMQTNGQWRVLIRYVLKRIDYKMQEEIIHWLHRHYRFDKIGIDAASGGGGASILHSLLYRQEFASMDYSQVLVPVMFGERIPVGFDTEGKELSVTTKSFGAGLLIQQLQQKTLVVSEIDYELISELERITKQKGISGTDVYYIMNEKGAGKADDDHNFASMICFCIATRDMSFQKKKRKRLGKTSGKF